MTLDLLLVDMLIEQLEAISKAKKEKQEANDNETSDKENDGSTSEEKT